MRESGWLPNPGKQPVADDVMVEVRYVFGETDKPWPARRLVWEPYGDKFDITHYREAKSHDA